jgi:hypothetical protein
MAPGDFEWWTEEPEINDGFEVVPFAAAPEPPGRPPPSAHAVMYEELIASPRFGNGAVGSVRLRTLIAICALLGIPLTRADRREKQKVIGRLESHRASILLRCEQSIQLTEEIQRLIVEQTISALLARNRGVQGVGTAIRAGLVMPSGNHMFPTDGIIRRG